MEGRMKATKWMALAAVVAMASACGDDDKGTGPNGRLGDFSAEVSGDLEDNLDGWSLFGNVEDDEGNTGFGLVMSEIEDQNDEGSAITVVRLNSTTMPTGEYDIQDMNGELADGDVVAMAVEQAEGGEMVGVFFSTGGTLNVTTSNEDAMRGTFTMDMTGFAFEDPETEYNVTVEGDFDAKRGEDEGVSLRVARVIKQAKTVRQAR
jgi:hypothetical protein